MKEHHLEGFDQLKKCGWRGEEGQQSWDDSRGEDLTFHQRQVYKTNKITNGFEDQIKVKAYPKKDLGK
jgi:hypothetical protein